MAHTYSKSLNTVTHLQNHHQNSIATTLMPATSATTIPPQHYSLGGQLPSIIHQRSVKSCDFEATIGNANLNNFDHQFNQNHLSQGIPITTAGDLAINNTFYNEYNFFKLIFINLIFIGASFKKATKNFI